MLALVSILFLGLPITVFVILFLIEFLVDMELSLSLTKFLRFCRFVIVGGIQAIIVGYVLAILVDQIVTPNNLNWGKNLLLLGLFMSIGNIVGYIRYKKFTKLMKSNPEILSKLSEVSMVGSILLFLLFVVSGYILFIVGNIDSHIQNVGATTASYGLVVLSAFLTILIQWLRQRH